MIDAMLKKSRKTAKSLGLAQAEFKKAYMEDLAVPNTSVDLLISNGVLNLTLDECARSVEVFRVLKAGGRL